MHINWLSYPPSFIGIFIALINACTNSAHWYIQFIWIRVAVSKLVNTAEWFSQRVGYVILSGYIILSGSVLTETGRQFRVHCTPFINSPSGQVIRVPQISTWNYGEFQEIIRVEISSLFPCRNSGEIMENFQCGCFPFFSLENNQGYFRMEISLEISKCHKRPYKGSQLGKNIPVMFYCQYFGELKVLQVQENFPLISTRNFRRKREDVSAGKFRNSSLQLITNDPCW